MIRFSFQRPLSAARSCCQVPAQRLSPSSGNRTHSIHRHESRLANSKSTLSRLSPTQHRLHSTYTTHGSLSNHQGPVSTLRTSGRKAGPHPHKSWQKESHHRPPPGQGRTQLLSAVLLGPIWISLAILSGESLRDARKEANQWTNIIVDILTPPSRKTNISYTDAVDNGDDEGYISEGSNLLDDEAGEDGIGRLRYSGPSPAEQWTAHVERFFTMGAHHLGIYFRTEDIIDHGSLPITNDPAAAAAKYTPYITTKLISVEDDVPPAHPEFAGLPVAPDGRTNTITIDNSSNARQTRDSTRALGRFVLAQIAFTDVGLDEDPNDPHALRAEKEPSRTGFCASAILDDLEHRLRQVGASRALLVTLDEDSYHTVYWDGRRFVTLNFFEFTSPPGAR